VFVGLFFAHNYKNKIRTKTAELFLESRCIWLHDCHKCTIRKSDMEIYRLLQYHKCAI